MARQKIAGGREIIFRHGLRSGSEHSSAEPCLIGNHRLANRSIDAAAFFWQDAAWPSASQKRSLIRLAFYDA